MFSKSWMFPQVDLKVPYCLMTREVGCEWYQSIGLIFLFISADFKKFLKDPGPLKNKKRFWADKQLFMGRYWIMGRPGLKTA